jgi:hypothetical protein
MPVLEPASIIGMNTGSAGKLIRGWNLSEFIGRQCLLVLLASPGRKLSSSGKEKYFASEVFDYIMTTITSFHLQPTQTCVVISSASFSHVPSCTNVFWSASLRADLRS